jgi:hypothetical protein
LNSCWNIEELPDVSALLAQTVPLDDA